MECKGSQTKRGRAVVARGRMSQPDVGGHQGEVRCTGRTGGCVLGIRGN